MRDLPQYQHADLGLIPDSDHTEDLRLQKDNDPGAPTPRPSEPSTHWTEKVQ